MNKIKLLDKVNINDLGKDIVNIEKELYEGIHFFDSELDINFDIKDKKNIFNKDTFNIFCAYKKSIHILLSEIKNTYIELSKENSFDFALSRPHITAEIVNKNSYEINQRYDFGTGLSGEVFGIIPVICQDSIDLFVNENFYSIKESQIAIFSTDKVFEFKNIPDNFLGIEIYITGLRNLDMQYYGKWIPIL